MAQMKLEELVVRILPRITALRRDIHAHPELAFQERRTADLVAAYLEPLGIDVRRGLAGTGVVGRLQCGDSGRAIGLRADMDALPLKELNTFAHCSVHDGCMHACGHDGHTAMLLGAAEALATLRNFDGTVYFIFQPAEEHEGGGRAMVEGGLFDLFPMEMVFGMHNWPSLPAGRFGVLSGPVMAGADRFEITIRGRGGHAAMPHLATDTVLAGASLVQALQTLVSRRTDPQAAAVVSVTRFSAGNADNILPESALLGGTVRCFSAALQDALEEGMGRLCRSVEIAHEVEVRLDYQRGYPPTINAEAPTLLCREVAGAVAGCEGLLPDLLPSMGAEDFAYMTREVPGCYVWLGSAAGEGGAMLHNPRYDFNDQVIPLGIRYWAELVARALPQTC